MTLSSDAARRHDFALSLIREAGELALVSFRDLAHVAVDTKLDGQDVVSAADKAVEALIRSRIAGAFPDDGFLGEETGLSEGCSGFHWTVDPIDGTSCFVHGLGSWCVSIALSDREKTISGLIFAPVSDDLYAATIGGGAYLNGAAIRVDTATTIETGLVGLGASHRVAPAEISGFLHALLTADGMFVRSGSGALSIAEVAAGRLAAYYEPHINAWDCLAGLLVVREAGGRTMFPGAGRRLLDGGPVIAVAPQIETRLLALIEAAAHKARS